MYIGTDLVEVFTLEGIWLSAAGWEGSSVAPSWQSGPGVNGGRGIWKGRSLSSSAGLVPETGSPRFRNC